MEFIFINDAAAYDLAKRFILSEHERVMKALRKQGKTPTYSIVYSEKENNAGETCHLIKVKTWRNLSEMNNVERLFIETIYDTYKTHRQK